MVDPASGWLRSFGAGILLANAERAMFGPSVTSDSLRALAAEPRIRVLQTYEAIPIDVWRLVDAEFCTRRPDVTVRVHDTPMGTCDYSFARELRHVRRFAAESREAANIEAIAEIPLLHELSLSIFEAKNFDLLDVLSPTLTGLSLGLTRSKKPRLRALSRFPGLKTLFIEGHVRDIEVISELRQLEDLTLRSVTTPDLSFLAPLDRLLSVDLKLGGIRRFDGLEDKPSVRYLELWQIRQLPDVDIVGRLPGLQNVFLQSLPLIRTLPPLDSAVALRRIVLEKLSGLCEVSALRTAPALEAFAVLNAVGLEPEMFQPVLDNPSVRRVGGWFGSDRKNLAFTRLAETAGKARLNPYSPFDYR